MWQQDEEEDHVKALASSSASQLHGAVCSESDLGGSSLVLPQNFLWEYAAFSCVAVAGKTKITLQ